MRQIAVFFWGMATERLEARIGAEQKAVIVEAAQLLGRSLTDFVVSSAYENALRALERHHCLELDAEESQRFAAALAGEEQEPAEQLRKEAQEYRNGLGN